MAKKKRINALTYVIIIIFICLIVVLGGLVGMQKKNTASKYEKVLVIGIDGMDPKILDKLFSEGKLPNLKKLSESGSYMNLNTSYPPHSPVAWTSIATGTNPGKHNIFDFIRRNPETHMPELSLSKTVAGIAGTNYESYVKADPFWRIISKAGIPSTIIRWPVTFPPEKVEGNLLSGLGVPDVKGFLSGYSFYTSEEVDSEKSSNKIIVVSEDNGIIDTEVYGPRTKKGNEIVEVPSPMEIRLNNDSVNIIVQGESYSVDVGEWSPWIRAKFKAGMFRNVYGTFKAYLVSIEPFKMYVTAMQIDPENPVVDISSPKDYSAELAKEIGDYYTLGIPEETDGLIDGRFDDKAFLSQVYEIDAERTKMFWKEFKNFDKGVYAFVFDSSDRVQHMFWNTKLLNNETLKVDKAIEDYLVKKDKFVAEVLGKIDNETLLMIISDHGFSSFERAVSINTWLVENGFMTLNGEIDENDDGALFKNVDWSKTRAYSLGFNSLYINLKGREGNGVVVNKKKVVDEIIAKLENLTDPKTGKKAVNKAYRSEEIYDGPLMNDAPDIIIGYNPGYRMSWQTAIGGFTKEVFSDNTKHWAGDHLIDPKFVPGVLFSNIKINKTSASQMDVAPTILDALNVTIPKEMDGRSLIR